MNRLAILATAAVVAAVLVFAFGPRSALRTGPTDVTTAALTVPGAFHIHTTRSDGALDKRAVAAAASRAGLRFAIFTDHGDARREPDAPEYIDGVLCIDGVEISSNDGHYVAIGMKAAPYPLGGDAEAVAEDVARLGGFGVVAHPVSTRVELRWSDWSVPIGGLEWLNADSEWRDESRVRLARSLVDYFWRPAGALAALLDRPIEALRRWDELSSSRSVVGLAGHDAHGGFGAETGGQQGRRLHLPSYVTSFRTFAVRAILLRTLAGDPARDAATLLEALRSGAVFTAIDAIAAPAALDFHATLGGETVTMGGTLPAAPGDASFRLRASVPAGARSVLKRNGEAVAQSDGGALDHTDSSPGAYRVEIEVAAAPGDPPVPWLVSNPIYRRSQTPDGSKSPAEAAAGSVVLRNLDWRAESDSGSTGVVTTTDDAVSLAYRLKPEPRASQFVALAADLRTIPQKATTIVLTGRAVQPMRVSVQLRFAGRQDERWGRSIYLEPSERIIRIPIAQMRGLGRSASRPEPAPPASEASSLLFVVDLTNTVPGSEGLFTLRDVSVGY